MSCNNLKAPLDGAFYYYGYHVNPAIEHYRKLWLFNCDQVLVLTIILILILPDDNMPVLVGRSYRCLIMRALN